jgi:hypothetical protein
MASTIDPTNHPADHIDHAQAMLGFLSLVIGGSRSDLCLTSRDTEGLSYILGHIEDNLKQALTRL